MQARFEDGTAMSDGEIRDQLMTLLMAGHETTATGLAWTLDLLVRHPDVLARARRGGDDVPARGGRRVAAAAAGRAVGGAAAGGRPGGRRPLAAGGHRRHARDVARPHPPRGVPGALRVPPRAFPRDPPSTYTWIPFGGGVRRCIGAPFAELEMRVVLGEMRASTCAPPGAAPKASPAATSPSRPATAPASSRPAKR